MTDSTATRPESSGLAAGAPTPLGLDRDMAFAEAERRLLGRELRPVTLDRFVVLRRIGQGAMGVVYAAHDPKLDRTVALKLVDASGYGTEGAREAQQRVEREARSAASLSHPNVVAIYDTGTVGDQVFLAMEFVEGTTLGAWLEQQPRDWRAIVSMFVSAGHGLAAAHDHGIVHRDFKPDNVLVGKDGRPRVVDFGLARPARTPTRATKARSETTGDDATNDDARTGRESSGTGRATLKSATAIAGTPAYMAPEQYEGRNIGAHSDQFGFCVALYEALYGERPYGGKGPAALAAAVLEGQRRPVPRGHKVPAAVLAVVERGLSTDPADRYDSMQALTTALVAARDRGRRRALVAGAALVLGASVVTTYGLAASDPPEPVDPCAAATAPLAQVWNDERRGRLRAALEEASPVGGSAAKTIEPRFDEFAERWSAQRQAACEAAQDPSEVSPLVVELRYACLDRGLRRMDVHLDAIESAGMMAVISGRALADQVDRLDRCDNREDLIVTMNGNGLSSATDSSTRAGAVATWDAGYEALDRAEAQYVVGDPQAAVKAARGVVTDAQAAGLRVLEAEARLMVGRWTGDESDLLRALDLAVAAGTPAQAAEIAIAIADLAAGTDGGDQALAEHHLRYAERFMERYPEDARHALPTRIPTVRGRLAKRRGDIPKAIEHLEAALTIAEQTLPPDHPDFAPLLGSLGQAHRIAGDTDRARALGERLLDLQTRTLGPAHPDLGTTTYDLGVAALEDRALDEAAKRLERARQIWTDALGPKHPMVSMPESALGEVARRRGDLDTAHALQTKALATREEASGPDSRMLVDPLDELGDIAALRGQRTEARERFERALKIRRATDDPYVAVTLIKLGRLRATEDDPSPGLAMLEEALTLRQKPGVDPLKLAEAQLALAQVLAATGRDRDRAQQLGRSAVALHRSEPRRPEERADAERWLIETFGPPPS